MIKHTFLALAATALIATPALAAPKTYQVTGPVVSTTDSTITVMKGKDKWEIQKGDAKLPDGVKEGSKVMIEYTMTATTITSKDKPATATKATDAKPAPAKKM